MTHRPTRFSGQKDKQTFKFLGLTTMYCTAQALNMTYSLVFYIHSIKHVFVDIILFFKHYSAFGKNFDDDIDLIDIWNIPSAILLSNLPGMSSLYCTFKVSFFN